jgi:hypothetical protein
MDGLCNAAGSDGGITIGGKRYQLSIPTGADLGDLERYVISLRGNPLKELAKCIDSYPVALQQAALRAASDSIADRSPRADDEEIGRFARSPMNLPFMLFIMLRRNHTEIDGIDAARKLLVEIDAPTMIRLTDVMAALSNVETAVKNSPSTEQVTETKDPHESRGLESIAT